MTLKTRVASHDWTSLHSYDLIERLEILKELRKLPMMDVAPILKTIPVEVVAGIIKLIEKEIGK